MAVLLRIIAESAVIKEIQSLSDRPEFKLGEPQPAESMSDAADAPIGPQEVQYGLELISIAASSATAVAIFVEKLIDIKNKVETSSPIKVVDPKTGQTKLSIDKDTSDDTIKSKIG